MKRLSLSAALLAAGCGVAGPLPAPLDAPDPPAPALETARGPLAVSIWAPEGEPAAVVLALHGFGDYAETAFGAAGPDWADRGIAVYAPDQRGFGRNPSNRHWPGPDALVDDAAAAAAEVAALHPGLPFFVLGHSMGGAVALAAGGEGRLPEGTRLILLAPALWGGESLGAAFRAATWTAAAVAPDLRLSPKASPRRIQPTDNIEELIRISRDPLRYAEPSPRELMGLIRLMDRALKAAPAAPPDSLTVMGAHDEVIPERSVRAGFDALPEPKRFAYVETGWHMLLIDLEGARVRELVADWILAKAAP